MPRNLLIPTVLLLAACTSGGDETANASTSIDAAPSSPAAAARTAAPPPAPDTDSRTPAKPGALRSFGDWTVGCDNGLSCTMASLAPEDGEFPDMMVTLTREPGPKGAISLDLSAQGEDAGDVSLAIDGSAPSIRAAKGGVGGADAQRLASQMVNGTRLVVRDAAGTTIATLSLKGAAAALRYMDDRQGRVGGTTALAALGPKPAEAVPAAPPLPVVVSPKPGGTAATLTKAALAALRKRAGCDLEGVGVSQDPEISALGDGKSLIVLPCSAGAYNLIAALFVTDGKSTEPARMDVASGMGPIDEQTGIPDVVNGGFEDGVLTSYAKGRGIGDCGITQSFVWDGSRFRLVEQSEMGECRGNPEFITTWRARVVRR
ncbi:DUF1176 domain-containing protein [Sphingosinicella sp. BN140058]|uniref:DUF1176 domain-containing protein n=1 Tax=Sphingosinicella sp. BN140058 TaxID=1892855 RepID=UPI0010124099|nr:DUF1176 domain-containing protein [Sphingosinicella sp. BN140058]QAY75952.1 DUF1176 domain-containing protein [Sphingosinicella sp. BN140058]